MLAINSFIETTCGTSYRRPSCRRSQFPITNSAGNILGYPHMYPRLLPHCFLDMTPSNMNSMMTSAQSGGSLDFSTFYNVIDGKLSPTQDIRHGINPATEELNPEVPVSTLEDVDRAVEAGQRAFRSWSKTTYGERQKALLAFADALEAERDNFANLLVKEQGKPVSSCPKAVSMVTCLD